MTTKFFRLDTARCYNRALARAAHPALFRNAERGAVRAEQTDRRA